MTIGRIKPSGWSASEQVTLPQINTLDANLARAFDKNGDTLEGGIVITGSVDGYGDIIANDASIEIVSSGTIDLASGSDVAFAVGTLNNLTVENSTIGSLDLIGDLDAFDAYIAIDEVEAYYLELGTPLKMTPNIGTSFGSISRLIADPPIGSSVAAPITLNDSLAWTITLGGESLCQPISLPRNDGSWLLNQFKSVRIYFRPIYRTNLPITPASFQLFAFNKSTGSTIAISNAFVDDPDDYADSLDLYTSYRSIDVPILSAYQSVNPDYEYSLRITSDITSDPELLAAFYYFGCEVFLSITQLDPC